MQPLENYEDPFKVLGVNSHAIVSHTKNPLIATVLRCRDVYVWDCGGAVFDSVPDEILKKLDQLRIVHRDRWQQIVSYHRAALLNRLLVNL
jgi:hypothetical protein